MRVRVRCYRAHWQGRGHETPGEDPLLAAEYAAHFVSGMQGDVSDPVYDGKWAKAIATCKHYDAYSLENFKCVSRFCALLLVLLTLLALETWLVPCWPAADVLADFPACVF